MEFALSICSRRVNRMEVPGKTSTCEQEQLVKLSAFVDFDCNSMVSSWGLAQIYGQEFPDRLGSGDTHGPVHPQAGIGPVPDHGPGRLLCLESVQCQHPAERVQGNWNRRREGLSILNILSRCGSLVEVSSLLHQHWQCGVCPSSLNQHQVKQELPSTDEQIGEQ